MGSKLRPLYDSLYMKIEYLMLARDSRKRIKERAKQVKVSDNFEEEYKTKVIPYWKKYGIKPNKKWYKVFSELSGKVDPRFIPHELLVKKVFPFYNSLIFSKTFQDKNFQDVFLNGFKQPDTLVRNISGIYQDAKYNLISEDDSINLCFREKEIIIKPSVGTGSADGIKFINLKELNSEDLKKVFHTFSRDFIVQKIMTQHEKMMLLHKESINTIRIITFLHDGQVDIINSFLRIGSGNSKVDNFSKGGYACKINEDGYLSKYALDNQYKWVKKSDNGIVFSEVVIPNYSKVVNVVSQAALQLTHFRIIGWDIAIDKFGDPVIIEYNLIPITSVDLPQNCCNNPYFGDFTEKVLSEVFLQGHDNG